MRDKERDNLINSIQIVRLPYQGHLWRAGFAEFTPPEAGLAMTGERVLSANCWIHGGLTSHGFDCLVVNPDDVPTTFKVRQCETDEIDADKFAPLTGLREDLFC